MPFLIVIFVLIFFSGFSQAQVADFKYSNIILSSVDFKVEKNPVPKLPVSFYFQSKDSKTQIFLESQPLVDQAYPTCKNQSLKMQKIFGTTAKEFRWKESKIQSQVFCEFQFVQNGNRIFQKVTENKPNKSNTIVTVISREPSSEKFNRVIQKIQILPADFKTKGKK